MILGRENLLSEAAATFLNFLEKRYQSFLKEGPAGTIRFCDGHSYLTGRSVLIDTPEGKLSGIVRSLSSQGYLLVENRDGSIFPVFSGDVTVQVI
jgi:BirA family biotin operon repressor/biotin-[acetyl-CoA-carboxylase] ligase